MTNNPGKLTRRAIFERDGWRCVYCEKAITPESGTLDHVIPAMADGGNTPDNLVAACSRCNHRKGHRPPPARVVDALRERNARFDVVARVRQLAHEANLRRRRLEARE